MQFMTKFEGNYNAYYSHTRGFFFIFGWTFEKNRKLNFFVDSINAELAF